MLVFFIVGAHCASSFAPTSVLSVRFEGKTVRGRIFWFDKAGLNSDDVLLAEIVGREVSGWLDRFYSLRQLAEQHQRKPAT
jgi:hypothetical protein